MGDESGQQPAGLPFSRLSGTGRRGSINGRGGGLGHAAVAGGCAGKSRKTHRRSRLAHRKYIQGCSLRLMKVLNGSSR